jgi:hypothetical protein
MSAIRGYTCTGVELGSILGIKSISFPAITQARDRVRTAGDANDAGTEYYQNFIEGPIVITLKKNVSLRKTLLTKVEAGTTDTFTVTKTGEYTYSGPAFLDVGEEMQGPDSEPEFQLTLSPETKWTRA